MTRAGVYRAKRCFGYILCMVLLVYQSAFCWIGQEFRESFAATQLSAQRMLSFVEARHSSMRRLVLMNSEGYWSGAFVSSPVCSPSDIPRHEQTWDCCEV